MRVGETGEWGRSSLLMCSAVQSNDEHFLLTISVCGKARRQQWQG